MPRAYYCFYTNYKTMQVKHAQNVKTNKTLTILI